MWTFQQGAPVSQKALSMTPLIVKQFMYGLKCLSKACWAVFRFSIDAQEISKFQKAVFQERLTMLWHAAACCKIGQISAFDSLVTREPFLIPESQTDRWDPLNLNWIYDNFNFDKQQRPERWAKQGKVLASPASAGIWASNG